MGYGGVIWNHTTRKIVPQDVRVTHAISDHQAWPADYLHSLEAIAGEKSQLVSQLEHHSRLTLILEDPNQMHSLVSLYRVFLMYIERTKQSNIAKI